MNKKIIISLVLTSIAVLAIIGYLLSKLTDAEQATKKTTMAIDIVGNASKFSQDNFHVQLELWEYVNDPTEERLHAFEQHERTLHDDLNNLLASVKDGDAVYSGGAADLKNISNNLNTISENWQGLLRAGEAYEEEVEAKNLKNPINFNENPGLYEKLVTMHQLTFENEKMFDDINFDGEIESFLTSQGVYVTNTRNMSIDVLYLCKKVALFLAILYLILLFLIALWLGRVISMIKKKNIASFCKTLKQ